MKTLIRQIAAVGLFVTSGLAMGRATDAPAGAGSTVTQLSFLTGLWQGTAPGGRTAEELISTGEGGVMLSAGREFKDGKCVFFDLVVFAEKAGKLVLIPHPNGKVSKDVFPATTVDGMKKRAVFENPAHDFPKVFVYEIVDGARLRITLRGEMQGKPVEEVYELKQGK
jgi:hypothetical protein